MSEDKVYKFSKINHTEDLNFDNSLNDFFALGVEGTIRENIQNSLDAKVEGSEDPVKVDIQLLEINKTDIPNIEELYRHINSLNGRNEYTTETIKEIRKYEKERKVNVLTIEDSNTTGLSGARNGKSENSKDTFGVYAYEKGAHAAKKDSSLEAVRGGSHGVGKIANNAASKIFLSFFSNCDENMERHLGGTIHLIDHELDGVAYRKTGYFTDEKQVKGKSQYFPYEYNNKYHEIFNKRSRGLKNIIPYISEDFLNGKEIVRAIIDNFFVAIIENKIIVSVSVGETNITVNNKTIVELVKDKTIYETQDYSEIKKNFTPIYIDTFLNIEGQEISVKSLKEEYKFKLYFNFNEKINKARVGIFRSVGMKIVDHKVKNKVNQPFNAVLMGGQKEDQFLKSLENESHTALEAKHIKNKEDQRNATRFINNLDKKIKEIIDEIYEEKYPTDGSLDTGDLIYETTVKFAKELESVQDKIKGNIKEPVITPDKNGGGEQEKRNRDHKPKRNSGAKGTGNSSPRRNFRESRPSNKTDGMAKYSIDGSEVERISLTEYELLYFRVDGLSGYKKCDIIFNIIDGEGVTLKDDQVNIHHEYNKAQDARNGEKYTISNNRISNVSLENNEIQIQLNYSNNFNRYLKYSYNLEVYNDL